MMKKFNVTGICYPTKHYMADISHKLSFSLAMIERGEYFVINRPRQYGKTTMLYLIASALRQQKKYAIFSISFEGIGDDVFMDEKVFSPTFISLLQSQAELYFPELTDFLSESIDKINSIASLSSFVTQLAQKAGKKIVLLIDEVDKSSNNQLFISFLAMLRNKFLMQEEMPTFQSVILAGVHDIKTLKLKLRTEQEQKYNSPWNIASEFKLDMNLSIDEIKPMLKEYARDNSVEMDIDEIAERLFYYTSGYPFLVSKICKTLDEDFSPKKKNWTSNDIEIAVNLLINEHNTNFDVQIKNLENDEDVYDLIKRIVIDNEEITYNVYNPTISLALFYGLISNEGNKLKIHNRIYAEVVADYMISKIELQKNQKGLDFGSGYKNENGTLNMEAIMLGFQAFMKKEYSRKDRDFLEKNGRLVFLAFLKPIINGSGYDFKEPQISEEKRLDIVITHLVNKYVVEVKLWRGEKAHANGLIQLTNYLAMQELQEGYLLIFDHAEVKDWKSEWIDNNGKKILAVWV